METAAFHCLLLRALDVDTGFETEDLLEAFIAAFALILLGLTLSAYKKTGLKRPLLVSAAFALFAVEVGILQLDDIVFAVGYQTDEIVIAAMEFAILLLFFLAVVVRE